MPISELKKYPVTNISITDINIRVFELSDWPFLDKNDVLAMVRSVSDSALRILNNSEYEVIKYDGNSGITYGRIIINSTVSLNVGDLLIVARETKRNQEIDFESQRVLSENLNYACDKLTNIAIELKKNSITLPPDLMNSGADLTLGTFEQMGDKYLKMSSDGKKLNFIESPTVDLVRSLRIPSEEPLINMVIKAEERRGNSFYFGNTESAEIVWFDASDLIGAGGKLNQLAGMISVLQVEVGLLKHRLELLEKTVSNHTKELARTFRYKVGAETPDWEVSIEDMPSESFLTFGSNKYPIFRENKITSAITLEGEIDVKCDGITIYKNSETGILSGAAATYGVEEIGKKVGIYPQSAFTPTTLNFYILEMGYSVIMDKILILGIKKNGSLGIYDLDLKEYVFVSGSSYSTTFTVAKFFTGPDMDGFVVEGTPTPNAYVMTLIQITDSEGSITVKNSDAKADKKEPSIVRHKYNGYVYVGNYHLWRMDSDNVWTQYAGEEYSMFGAVKKDPTNADLFYVTMRRWDNHSFLGRAHYADPFNIEELAPGTTEYKAIEFGEFGGGVAWSPAGLEEVVDVWPNEKLATAYMGSKYRGDDTKVFYGEGLYVLVEYYRSAALHEAFKVHLSNGGRVFIEEPKIKLGNFYAGNLLGVKVAINRKEIVFGLDAIILRCSLGEGIGLM
jgi:hypothetical protein